MIKDDISNGADDLKEFKSLLKENLEISRKIYANTEKMRNYFFWLRIAKSIRWTIIIAAFVAGAIYSKPYIKQFIGLYKNIYPSLFNQPISDKLGAPENQIKLDPEIIKVLQDFLQNYQK